MKQIAQLHKLPLDKIPDVLQVQVKPTNKKLKVLFSTLAYVKIHGLVNHYKTEVAWHAITEYDRDNSTIVIKDILVYPQIVNAAHVESDDDNYGMWLSKLSDDEFNNLRAQGHSHCDFGVSPSGPDLVFYDKFMREQKPDYYLFMIINKAKAHWFNFYDNISGLLYESTDITYDILFDDTCLSKYQESFTDVVVTKAPVITSSTTVSYWHGQRDTVEVEELGSPYLNSLEQYREYKEHLNKFNQGGAYGHIKT